MSLWTKAQQLPAETLQRIRAIYGDHFPIEVRHFLAPWIEEKFWSEIERDNPQHEQYVANLVRSLIDEMENKAATLNTEDLFLTKLKLMEAAKMFRVRYSSNPLQLFTYVRNCLDTEFQLVQASSGENLTGIASLSGTNTGVEILHKLEILRRRTQDTAEDLRRMEQDQESFALQYHECTKLGAHLQQQPQNTPQEQKLKHQKDMMEQMLNQKIAGLIQLRLAFGDKIQETIMMLNTLQAQVLDEELIHWKREQQLAGNGAPFNSSLDNIQEWCESLAELIWLNRQQIKEAERLKQKLALGQQPGIRDVIPQLNTQITQLLSSLVTSTFIIEKQPPQVMKTNTRFTATVRLLVGGKLNVHMTPPQVKVTIISESQANGLLKNEKLGGKCGDASGEILNHTGSMEYQQSTRQLSVSFRFVKMNMQLKKIKRAEKKGTESVMDEKFSLLFQSQFNVGGGELMFQVWTLSLPVVVIVHGNQEPHAHATVTWDNAFAEPGRIPFAVPDKVPWVNVAETLTLKFRAATGRPLTEDNLRFLAEKAFRGNFSDNNQYLSWAQFCKEPLPERNFTFWEWFYAVMKLTREHLRGPWVDGAILGFVRKKQAEEMLSNCPNGTFLLRFSDSELGGVTIAWVSENSEVFMLQPFTSKDFAIRSLADRIADLSHLVFLYPEISKDHAFGKYYTPFTENMSSSSNGYVKPLLVTQVPGLSGLGTSSYPNTPQHPFLQSPESVRDTPSVASSYAGSVATAVAGSASSLAQDMDYLDQLEDVQLDLNGLVSLGELMQGYQK